MYMTEEKFAPNKYQENPGDQDNELDEIENDPDYKDIIDLLKANLKQIQQDQSKVEYTPKTKKEVGNNRETSGFELEFDYAMPKHITKKIFPLSEEYQQAMQEQRVEFVYNTHGIFGYNLYRVC